MRRFLFGVVIASVTAAMPTWALGGDREIAKTVMTELQEHKAAGKLKGFDIDMKVDNGVVYLTGQVASEAQRALVLDAATEAAGLENVVCELSVKGAEGATSVAQPVVPASTTAPSTAPSPQDMQITDEVIAKLQQAKTAGDLRGFELDVSTVNGDVWLRGKVTNEAQKNLVLTAARRTRGVARVIDDITVVETAAVRQVSTTAMQLEPAYEAPVPVPQMSSMPITAQPVAAPQMYSVQEVPNYAPQGGYVQGTPVPMNARMASFGAGAPRYDQPNMPAYAWPSYAAHPNYAAVTYPKQYSPSAWPYIGPFYPYPQVPLGWRKVSLEWDDGLWYLDFTSK